MNATQKGYVLVEGHGEVQAAANLLARLSSDLGIQLPWATPIRWKNLYSAQGFETAARFVATKRDAGALLVLRDEDDGCPKERGPELAAWLRRLSLPFPSAIVLLHPEYEVLFLPCLGSMAGRQLDGRPGLVEGTKWDGESWESRRGVKEWLSQRFPTNRSYKPVLDQLPLTRLIDFEQLRNADVPCFGTLERALRFLSDSRETAGVYPGG